MSRLAGSVVLFSFLVMLAGVAFPQDSHITVCPIKPERLSLPSYTFSVVDLKGSPVKEVSGQGTVRIEEGIWQGSVLDGFWLDTDHQVPFHIRYDRDKNVFISEPVQNIHVQVGKQSGLLGLGRRNPLTLHSVKFEFTRPNGDHGFFIFFFEDEPWCEHKLPDSDQPLKVVVQYDKSGAYLKDNN